MRKIPTALLVILTVSIANLAILRQNSFALYQENDIIWWSIDELMEFSRQVDTETEAICGDNISCRQEYYFNNLEGDNPKYRALNRLYQTQFRITSINPEAETMEVLFLDQNPMLRQMGINDGHYPLDYIFMAWFYQHNPNITNYYYAYPDEGQFPDDLHIIYSSGEYQGGIFPSNQKFSLPINQTNLSENPLGRIYVATFGEQYNSKGSIDYASCLRDPDYIPGKGCQLMISADYGEQFFPSKSTTLQNDELNINDTEENYQNHTEETENVEGYGSANSNTETLSDSFNNVKILSNDSKILETPSVIKTPETGTFTPECNKVVEFPWWLALLLILGNTILLWLFWPKSQKNS